jgi:hypothetical protein
VKMLCVDGPLAGRHLDVPYPTAAVYRLPELLGYPGPEIPQETSSLPREREFIYHCHRFRILSSIVLVGSLNIIEPPEDAAIKYLLTDAAREAIAQ